VLSYFSTRAESIKGRGNEADRAKGGKLTDANDGQHNTLQAMGCLNLLSWIPSKNAVIACGTIYLRLQTPESGLWSFTVYNGHLHIE
jgi:hypothetical protein